MQQAHAAQRNTLNPVRAVPSDVPAWRLLAAEVEALFGPMVGQVDFEVALQRNIDRGSAWCIRDASPDGSILAGVFLSLSPSRTNIRWFAVAARARRSGVGRALLRHGLEVADPALPVDVITFTEENEAGIPARLFYESFGFVCVGRAPDAPDGGPRDRFVLAPRVLT